MMNWMNLKYVIRSRKFDYHGRIVLPDAAAVGLDDLPAGEIEVHLPVEPGPVPPLPDLLLAPPQLLPLLRGQPLVAVHREVVALVVDHLNEMDKVQCCQMAIFDHSFLGFKFCIEA